jgi:hypothetical protein
MNPKCVWFQMIKASGSTRRNLRRPSSRSFTPKSQNYCDEPLAHRGTISSGLLLGSVRLCKLAARQLSTLVETLMRKSN